MKINIFSRRGIRFAAAALVSLCCSCSTPRWREAPNALPVRGLHIMAPAKKDLGALLAFIRTALPREGVNTLVVEFDYHFDFQSHPEFSSRSALDRADVRRIVRACRRAHVELIPEMDCLGHQSWAGQNGELLAKHPDFDESPGEFPGNSNIYCRSYCPLNPAVHKVLFDLMDELADACEAKAFHCGMDEVFILADPGCPRCNGKNPAELFAGEVRALYDHLASTGRRMWIWGDRLLDGRTTGLGKWEASENGTYPAIDHIPKDIVICDWHYETSPPTPEYFAAKGFDVVECPARDAGVGIEELGRIRAMRRSANPALARHALGVLQTSWSGFPQFLAAYDMHRRGGTSGVKKADDAAVCFTTLFRAVRDQK